MYFGRNLSLPLMFLVPCQEYSRMISTVKGDPTNACDVWGVGVATHFGVWVPGWISAYPRFSFSLGVGEGSDGRRKGGFHE